MLVVSSSSVFGVQAANGGAIANEGAGTATLVNSTFAEDTASGKGGGIFNSGGNVLVTNCTIAQSGAPAGGGIAVAATAGTVTLANTLVGDNSPSDVSGSVIAKYSLFGNTTGLTLLAGSGNNQLNVNPEIDPPLDYGGPTLTDALLPGSPAIDAGSNALAVDASGNPLLTDQRGGVFQRISGASVDIGAFEFETFNLVVSTTSDENDGNESPGHLSLTEAIELAADNFAGSDTITFDPTVFGTPQTITLNPANGPLVLDGSVTITGPAAGVTVAGDNTGRVLDINTNFLETVAVSISNMTFTGGGIFNDAYNTLTLSNCHFSDNVNTTSSDTKGGGVENLGTLHASGCTFTNNQAVQGAGLFNYDTATLVDCGFSYNQAVDNITSAGGTAGLGGAIDNEGVLTATNTTFSGNTSTYSGGAISSPGTLTLTDCELTDNSTGGSGGALDTQSGLATPPYSDTESFGTVILTGCTLSGNSASSGGGINAWSTSVDVINCTLSDNFGTLGGAIENEGGGGIPAGHLTVTGSTFTGNSTSYDGGAILDYGIASLTDSTFTDNSAAGAGGGGRDS